MTIRLYLEEDSMRHALVRALRSRGVDVVTALNEGMIACDDERHLDYATAQGMILSKQQRYSVGEQMRRLLRLISARSAEEMRDRVEFLSGWD